MELTFLGDIMFGWKIRENIARYGHAYPFEKLDLPLSEKGLVFGNLETVVSDSSLASIRLKNDRIMSPASCLENLKKAGIYHVSLANNHVYDYGREGLLDTLANLEKQGIHYFGAGRTRREAKTLRRFEHGGVTLGILSRTFTCEAANQDMDENEPQAAELLRDELLVAAEKARSECDILIIILHFGFEYCQNPDPEDVIFCRSLVDKGADLVIGHHPHVFQGIERYGNGLIAYSLGNFLFDELDPAFPETSIGIMLKVQIENPGRNSVIREYTLHPVAMNDKGQVSLAQEETRNAVREKINALSDKLKMNPADYKTYADPLNSKIILSVRKKEIIRYLKKGDIPYLLKKAKNIKWIHLRLSFRLLSGFLTRRRLRH